MRLREIEQFVAGTADPAFAVDGQGNIAAWNSVAAEKFGISPAQAVQRPCSDIIRGVDDDGVICSDQCIVMRAANDRRPIGNFDLRINTKNGAEWFNVSLTIVDVANAARPYTIHILRLIDVYKRLELLLRNFIQIETDMSPEKAAALISSGRSLAREVTLTPRELQILKLVAKSEQSPRIADKLNISQTTVDNHIQHILKKLDSHSRLEAVLRAEHSGLL
jgi:DNA-binding CsgD family transcriptional regulator